MKRLNILAITLALAFSGNCFAQDDPLSLAEYKKKENNKMLDYVIKVDQDKNILTLAGYKGDLLIKDVKVKLDKRDVLAIIEWNHIFQKWVGPSLTTVPFKVRPGFDNFKTSASSGLTNLGLNFDLVRRKSERYFDTGTKSTSKWSAGIWLGPTAEELDSIQTEGFLKKDVKSKQLFVSSALTLNYSYNNFTFTFVPIGFDIPTSSVGKEWVYNNRRWWGFGIGVEPKALAALISGSK